MNILITGDFCPNDRVNNLINNKQVAGIFNDFLNIIERNEYNITNFECPLKPASYTKIKKIGPSLATNEKAVEVLKESGFNVLTLANNHIKDFGEEGIECTIKAIKNMGLYHVGAGKGIQKASETLYLGKEKKIALINVAENEFSTTYGEGFGAHGLDIINTTNKIKEAKNKSSHVILIYHGGHEMYQYPSPRMKKTFRFFVDNGCDAVICHHSHCYSGYEIYKGAPIFYGLGNFVFDWAGYRKGIWNKGYAVELKIQGKIDFNIIPYIQGDDMPGVRLMNKEEVIVFQKDIEKINKVINNDALLYDTFINLVKTMGVDCKLKLQPYDNRLLRGFFRRRLIPDIVSKQKKVRFFQTITCESHRDPVWYTYDNAVKEVVKGRASRYAEEMIAPLQRFKLQHLKDI